MRNRSRQVRPPIMLMATLTMLLIPLQVPAFSQKGERWREAGKVEKELMQLERDWSTAFLKHEPAVVARILADEYVGIDGRGFVSNKAQEIEEAAAPKPGAVAPPFLILDESVTDMKVRLYGNVAVVNGRVIEKIKRNDKEGEIQYRRTTVWVKRQGRWQCVSFHGSRIIEPD